MTSDLKTSLVASLTSAAEKAGLVLVSVKQGADFHGQPTAIFELGLSGEDAIGRSLKLELSDAFDFDKPNLLPEMTAHLAGEAKRLRNPRPDCYVTLGGLPLALGGGVGAELRMPLGVTIVGGLILSQMLTLFTTPVIYIYFDRLAKRFKPRELGAVQEHQPASAD